LIVVKRRRRDAETAHVAERLNSSIRKFDASQGIDRPERRTRSVDLASGHMSTGSLSPAPSRTAAFLFDLDGTLVDSVYEHVLAWHEALEHVGIELSVWRVHRRIGMSGGLMIRALLREYGAKIDPELLAQLQRRHAEAYARRAAQIRPLPGAKDLLQHLTSAGVPWTVATSAWLAAAQPTLEALGIDPARVPVVTRDQVEHAKPDPDLFIAAAGRLSVDIAHAVVIGDSVWDLLAARRARALGVGLLSGGYGREELERAGAYRVYEDPRDLLGHLDEIGVRDEIAHNRTT
jgi:HAD superfamily hydrolase (TIGR01509 family)